MRSFICIVLTLIASAQAYWLMGIEDFITTERLDPVVSPGKVSSHVHSVLGGSNFRFNTSTEALRQSECTSIPIPEDKSNYWFPQLYFQWANSSFTSLNGGAVISLVPLLSYYLFNDKPGTTTAFPDDFRMLSGDPTLRTYDPNSYAQQAVTFLCLDFDGVSTRHNELPAASCPSGIRAQINFPSCWDGKNLDSPDHKSHVSFLSGGPDSGTCSDPKYPVTLPRIFIEVYWASNDFEQMKHEAKDPSQPLVFAHGDPTGYGYHADFINGWDKGVLQNAVDNCHCNEYGDPTCCVEQGMFHMNQGQNCRITKSINEQTTGTLPKLPGNNPVQLAGQRAIVFPDNTNPQLIAPVYAYTGNTPTQVGSVIPGSGDLPTPATSMTSSSGLGAPLPAPLSSVSKPTPFTSAPSAPESSVLASAPQPPISSYFPSSSSVPLLSVSPQAPHQVISSVPSVSSLPGTSSFIVPVLHTSTATQPTNTQVDGEPCDPESASHSMHVPSTTSYVQPTETPADDDDDGEPCYSEPASTNSTPVPLTTPYMHTIPATTVKHSFPTFSMPAISIPSVPVPPLSIPHMPGFGSLNNGGGDGNVHVGVSSGLNSDLGHGSGLGSPHYNNNPGIPIPIPAYVPHGHSVINNNPSADSDGSIASGSSNTGKPRRCPSRRTKRSILAERPNAPIPVKGIRNVAPASRNLSLNHVHHSRRRFRKNLDRD
ncbi:hypothetical protein Ac2012v2_002811 [Leucoagaricus gongylophorus]